MFPLSRGFLFPRQVLPLHVFEPRYRRLVEALLDTAGRFVVATIPPDEPVRPAGRPPRVLPVAGLGEIVRHQRLPDGRFYVWVLGLLRTRLEEVASPHPYRLVRCLPFHELDAGADEAAQLADDVRQATTALLREPLPLPADTSLPLLIDLLLQALRPPTDALAEAFAEPSVARRARLVLRLARRSPPAS
jgi:Lon protease-like protein